MTIDYLSFILFSICVSGPGFSIKLCKGVWEQIQTKTKNNVVFSSNDSKNIAVFFNYSSCMNATIGNFSYKNFLVFPSNLERLFPFHFHGAPLGSLTFVLSMRSVMFILSNTWNGDLCSKINFVFCSVRSWSRGAGRSGPGRSQGGRNQSPL
jgi:hypothetical protein